MRDSEKVLLDWVIYSTTKTSLINKEIAESLTFFQDVRECLRVVFGHNKSSDGGISCTTYI